MEFKGTKEYPTREMKWHLIGNGTYHMNKDLLNNQIGCLPICRIVENSIFFNGNKEIEANKLLISKAPEMLEMLQYCYNFASIEDDEMFFKIQNLIKQATEL